MTEGWSSKLGCAEDGCEETIAVSGTFRCSGRRGNWCMGATSKSFGAPNCCRQDCTSNFLTSIDFLCLLNRMCCLQHSAASWCCSFQKSLTSMSLSLVQQRNNLDSIVLAKENSLGRTGYWKRCLSIAMASIHLPNPNYHNSFSLTLSLCAVFLSHLILTFQFLWCCSCWSCEFLRKKSLCQTLPQINLRQC